MIEERLIKWYPPDEPGLDSDSYTTPLSEFIAGVRLWIFDADGTLRRCTVPGQVCPNKPGEWELIPEAVSFLRLIDWSKARFSIVSNQGGVELGYLSNKIALQMLQDTLMAIAESLNYPFEGTSIHMCPSNDKSDPRRKPNAGMLDMAIKIAQAHRDDVVMVGDMESDKQAALNAGVRFVWAKDLFEASE